MGIRGNDLDDDEYYADLEKWILKLTADDDDEEDCAFALWGDECRFGVTGSAYVPSCVSLKMGGNVGTGVFIPQIKIPGQVVAKNEKGRVRRCRRKGEEQIKVHKCDGGDVKIST